MSFLATTFHERSRFRREIATRWDSARLGAYSDYLTATTTMASAAGRVAHFLDVNPEAFSSTEEEELINLKQAEIRRAECFEAVVLLGDGATVSAGHQLNTRLWAMENMARGRSSASISGWRSCVEDYVDALLQFHRCARSSLGVHGESGESHDLPSLANDAPLPPADLSERPSEPTP